MISRPIVLIQGEAPLETIQACLEILYRYALEHMDDETTEPLSQ
jgi:hypothetical protein